MARKLARKLAKKPVRKRARKPVRKFSKAAGASVERAMQKRNKGTLKSGGSGRAVKSRKQAIAIGLSEARRAGEKVPKAPAKKSRRKAGGRKTSGNKTSTKKTSRRGRKAKRS